MTGARPLTALVLAGSRDNRDPVAISDGKRLKAFVEIDGKPMIDHVLLTLENLDIVGKIIVCIPPDEVKAREPDGSALLEKMVEDGRAEILSPANGPSASVLKVLDRKEPDHDLLVTTADHPLLDKAMVKMFLKGIRLPMGGLAMALAPLSVVKKAAPKTRRTRLRFRDGSYSGCNLFFLRGRESRKAVEFWQHAEKNRKTPWRLALAINPLILIGYLFNLVSLSQALAALSKRCGTEIQAVIMHDGKAAIDVDSVQDLQLVKKIMAGKDDKLKV